MPQLIKTLVYAGVSLLVLGSALLVRFWPTGEPDDDVTGTELFDFDDPLKAQSLEIARYDDLLHQVNRFSVNRSSGRWVIPSHGNYPADADEQMKNAATSLMGLKILDSVSDRESDHEEYGVVEPNAEKLERGAKGVGVLVSIKDAKGEPLAELIVGKEVEQPEGARFVRRPGNHPRVYLTKIDLSKLSTNFGDWIEKDLLQLDPANIQKVTFNDYTMSMVLDQRTGEISPRRNRRLLMTVEKETGGDWRLQEMTRYKEGEAVDLPLASSEELNDDQLDGLTQALDKLVIVDVRRKPKELGADLRADKGIKLNRESYESLLKKGYIPALAGDEQNPYIELFSKNGDLIVETKQGVRYLLRFGDLAESNDASDLGKVNRYLMVACSVAEEKFPKPQPPKLPELPAGPELPPMPNKPASDTGDAAACDPLQEEGGEEKPSTDEKSGEEKPGEEKTPQASPESDDAPKTEDGDKKDEPGKKDEPPAAKEPVDPVLDKARIEAERTKLLKDYETRLEVWREERRAAAEKVSELNARFADWYYVIPEEVYTKIHLGRGELIRERANVAVEGDGIDAFRYLEENGPNLPPAEDDHDHAAPPFGGPGFGLPPG